MKRLIAICLAILVLPVCAQSYTTVVVGHHVSIETMKIVVDGKSYKAREVVVKKPYLEIYRDKHGIKYSSDEWDMDIYVFPKTIKAPKTKIIRTVGHYKVYVSEVEDGTYRDVCQIKGRHGMYSIEQTTDNKKLSHMFKEVILSFKEH